MNTDLLVRSRLRPSFTRVARLRRSRLVDHLLAHQDCRVTVIEGPGGSGKSTLVYDVLRELESPYAWYSIQEEDRELPVFLGYLLEALKSLHPGLVDKATAVLHSTDGRDLSTVATILLNDILDSGTSVRLVLDDLHLIVREPGLLDFLKALLLNAPANLHVFITTREPLQLPLARMRTKGTALIVPAAELELSENEVAILFRDVWDCPVDAQLTRLLMDKTGGWITGLVLIQQTLEMRRRRGTLEPADTIEFVSGLAGTNIYIFDYLAEEILQTLPRHVQTFLKETCLLDQFDVETATFVGADNQALATLENIGRRGLFLLHLDEEGRQYRYHALFLSFLRQFLLREVGPDGIRQRHQRLGEYFEARNVGQAIHHYFEAQSWPRAQSLLELHGRSIVEQGWTERVGTWLDRLPDSVLRGSALLQLLAASVAELKGNWIVAMRTYDALLKQAIVQRERGLQAQVLERAAICLARYGDRPRMERFMADALESCPEDDLSLRSRALTWMGALMAAMGREVPAGHDLMREGYRMAYSSGDPEAIAAACISYGFVYALSKGQLALGNRVLGEGVELFRKLDNAYMVLHLVMNRATVLLIAGEHEQAQTCLTEALKLATSFENSFVGVALDVSRAHLAVERLNLVDAATHLTALQKVEVPLQIKPWYLRILVLYHTHQHNYHLAHTVGEEMQEVLRTQGPTGFYAPDCYLALCYLASVQGGRDAARQAAEKALQVAEQGDMSFWIMKSLLYLAWSLGLERPSPEARKRLERALAVTQDEGYHSFWRTHLPQVALPALLMAREMDSCHEVAAKLLEQRGEQGVEDVVALASTPGSAGYAVPAIHWLQTLQSSAAVRGLRRLKDLYGGVTRKAASRALRQTMVAVPVSPSHLEIKTLGRFEIWRADGPVASDLLNRKKIAQLLKLILSSPQCSVLVEVITEVVWPEIPPEKSRHNLNVHLSLLRNVLFPDRTHNDKAGILLVGDAYQLALGPQLRVDAFEFQAQVDQADTLYHQEQDRAALELYTRACAAYQGDYLPDDVYEEWTETIRSRLRRKYMAALVRAGDIHMRLDEPRQAMGWFGRVLAAEPSDDAAMRRMLRACAAARDGRAALQEFQAHAEALKKLGLEPSHECSALFARLFKTGPPPRPLPEGRIQPVHGSNSTAMADG